jgi:hypothetical protein
MTLRSALLPLFVLLAVWGSTAEASEGWIRYYTVGEDVRVGAVHATSSGGFTVAGSVATEVTDPIRVGIFLLHIEADGTLPYPVLYDWGGVRVADDLLATPDGGWLFAGSTTEDGAEGNDFYLLRVDGPGQTLWSGIFGNELDENAMRVVAAADGGYFAIGNQVDPNDVIADPSTPGYGGLEGRCAPYIVRINDDGAPLWETALRGEENVVVFDGAATKDGGCLVLATAYGFPDRDDALRLIKLDAAGDIAWTQTWSDGSTKGYALATTSAGEILVAGAQSAPEDSERATQQTLLMLLDQDGKEIWSRRFGDPMAARGAHAVLEAADGSFVVAGAQTKDLARYDDDVFLFAVSALGDVLWEQVHPVGEHVMVAGLAEAAGGGFAVTGSASKTGERFRVLLLRTDGEGRITGS